ncbi:hypothetical protein BJX76DRAFT_303703 [Aspergillus varians]
MLHISRLFLVACLCVSRVSAETLSLLFLYTVYLSQYVRAVFALLASKIPSQLCSSSSIFPPSPNSLHPLDRAPSSHPVRSIQWPVHYVARRTKRSKLERSSDIEAPLGI